MKRSICALLLPFLFASLLLCSCIPSRRPAPQGVPAIPRSIFRGDRKEPQLKVYMKDSGQVKTMNFEEYIAGVVAAEMEPSWPVEALAAQAILARTFTLEKIVRDGGVPSRNADASTDIEEFQAYDASRINNNVREAVKRTRGMVVSHNGQFIKAWFHANSGGKTATALEGLGFNKVPTPYIVVVDDPVSVQAAPPDQTNWTATFSADELKKAVQEVGQNPGGISRVEIAEKGPSGRATRMRIGSATVSAPALRLALGSTKMRSTLIESVQVQGGRITMKGKGFGHGVGLSQWGAKGKADQGAKAADIVNSYFRGTTMHKIWE